MYALVNVCYLRRNKQLFICSSDSSLALITLVSLINLALLRTHVVFHDNVSLVNYVISRTLIQRNLARTVNSKELS